MGAPGLTTYLSRSQRKATKHATLAAAVETLRQDAPADSRHTVALLDAGATFRPLAESSARDGFLDRTISLDPTSAPHFDAANAHIDCDFARRILAQIDEHSPLADEPGLPRPLTIIAWDNPEVVGSAKTPTFLRRQAKLHTDKLSYWRIRHAACGKVNPLASRGPATDPAAASSSSAPAAASAAASSSAAAAPAPPTASSYSAPAAAARTPAAAPAPRLTASGTGPGSLAQRRKRKAQRAAKLPFGVAKPAKSLSRILKDLRHYAPVVHSPMLRPRRVIAYLTKLSRSHIFVESGTSMLAAIRRHGLDKIYHCIEAEADPKCGAMAQELGEACFVNPETSYSVANDQDHLIFVDPAFARWWIQPVPGKSHGLEGRDEDAFLLHDRHTVLPGLGVTSRAAMIVLVVLSGWDAGPGAFGYRFATLCKMNLINRAFKLLETDSPTAEQLLDACLVILDEREVALERTPLTSFTMRVQQMKAGLVLFENLAHPSASPCDDVLIEHGWLPRVIPRSGGKSILFPPPRSRSLGLGLKAKAVRRPKTHLPVVTSKRATHDATHISRGAGEMQEIWVDRPVVRLEVFEDPKAGKRKGKYVIKPKDLYVAPTVSHKTGDRKSEPKPKSEKVEASLRRSREHEAAKRHFGIVTRTSSLRDAVIRRYAGGVCELSYTLVDAFCTVSDVCNHFARRFGRAMELYIEFLTDSPILMSFEGYTLVDGSPLAELADTLCYAFSEKRGKLAPESPPRTWDQLIHAKQSPNECLRNSRNCLDSSYAMLDPALERMQLAQAVPSEDDYVLCRGSMRVNAIVLAVRRRLREEDEALCAYSAMPDDVRKLIARTVAKNTVVAFKRRVSKWLRDSVHGRLLRDIDASTWIRMGSARSAVQSAAVAIIAEAVAHYRLSPTFMGPHRAVPIISGKIVDALHKAAEKLDAQAAYEFAQSCQQILEKQLAEVNRLVRSNSETNTIAEIIGRKGGNDSLSRLGMWARQTAGSSWSVSASASFPFFARGDIADMILHGGKYVQHYTDWVNKFWLPSLRKQRTLLLDLQESTIAHSRTSKKGKMLRMKMSVFDDSSIWTDTLRSRSFDSFICDTDKLLDVRGGWTDDWKLYQQMIYDRVGNPAGTAVAWKQQQIANYLVFQHAIFTFCAFGSHDIATGGMRTNGLLARSTAYRVDRTDHKVFKELAEDASVAQTLAHLCPILFEENDPATTTYSSESKPPLLARAANIVATTRRRGRQAEADEDDEDAEVTVTFTLTPGRQSGLKLGGLPVHRLEDAATRALLRKTFGFEAQKDADGNITHFAQKASSATVTGASFDLGEVFPIVGAGYHEPLIDDPARRLISRTLKIGFQASKRLTRKSQQATQDRRRSFPFDLQRFALWKGGADVGGSLAADWTAGQRSCLVDGIDALLWESTRSNKRAEFEREKAKRRLDDNTAWDLDELAGLTNRGRRSGLLAPVKLPTKQAPKIILIGSSFSAKSSRSVSHALDGERKLRFWLKSRLDRGEHLIIITVGEDFTSQLSWHPDCTLADGTRAWVVHPPYTEQDKDGPPCWRVSQCKHCFDVAHRDCAAAFSLWHVLLHYLIFDCHPHPVEV